MKKCVQCNGKFGLVRQAGYYVSEWLLLVHRQFCSEKCKQKYDQERLGEYRVWYHRMWLNTHQSARGKLLLLWARQS